MRRGALLNDAQVSGMLPVSVAGGENAAGNWSLMAGFCGPGSVTLLGFVAFTAPCGGSSGLPKVMSLFTGAAFAGVIAAAVTTPPTAAAANASPLVNIFTPFLYDGRSRPVGLKNLFCPSPYWGLTRTGIDFAAGVLLFRS